MTQSSEWPPEVLEKAKATQEKIKAAQAEYPELFLSLRKCLLDHDPLYLNYGVNTDLSSYL